MANIKSSKRSIRSDKRRNELNRFKRARLRTARKNFQTLLSENKMEEATAAYVTYTSLLDKAAKTNLIKAGNASRKKSRVALAMNKAKAQAS